MTLRPSTADSTEIAGVIMLSPENSEAPKMPSKASTIAMRPQVSLTRADLVLSVAVGGDPNVTFGRFR